MTLLEDRRENPSVADECQKEIERLRGALTRIAALDYDGTEPRSRKIARQALMGPSARKDLPPAHEGFEHFWSVFPRRNGVKVGKARAKDKWALLTLYERRLAYRAATFYATACDSGGTIARDAERFLANSYWRDWLQEPVVARTPPRPPHISATAKYDSNIGQWVA